MTAPLTAARARELMPSNSLGAWIERIDIMIQSAAAMGNGLDLQHSSHNALIGVVWRF